jgi:hypothetical protein
MAKRGLFRARHELFRSREPRSEPDLDGTECEVREAETGPEGLIEHNRNILEARTKLFKTTPTITS